MKRVAALILISAGAGSLAAQQGLPVQAPQQPVIHGEVQVLPVKGNVYMVAGAGTNITLQVGDDGVMVVDTGTAPMADKVLAAIRQLTNKPILWIVNTSATGDYTGGNEPMAKAGRSIAQNDLTGQPKLFTDVASIATIVGHEKVLRRMSASTGPGGPRPVAAWPSVTFFDDQRELYLNDEPVFVIHQPAAISDGSSLVFFRRSDVISAGEVYVTTSYPVIDTAAGGTIDGEIAALNRILDIAVAKEKAEGGTYIIPGRGRLADEADVFVYRNMVTMIRDRVADMRKKGMSLEQIKTARPSLDYDARYATASWTAAMFVDAVYRTLPAGASVTP